MTLAENTIEAPTLNRARCPKCNAPLPNDLKPTFTSTFLMTSFGGLGGAGSTGSVGAQAYGSIPAPKEWRFKCPSCRRDFASG